MSDALPKKQDCFTRFIKAQEMYYPLVLNELMSGRKRTHWMWFIFPQLAKFGHSAQAKYYGIDDVAHAKAYLSHPVLGERLRECCALLLNIPHHDSVAIFGELDSLKLQSSMTLFDLASGDDVFFAVLQKYFAGERDLASLN